MSRFFTPTQYNGDTKCAMWMSMISDGHDMHCGCTQPFAHLLDQIFPVGHQDRNKTIEQIINRDIQLCHSGGEDEENHGLALGESAATLSGKRKEGEDFQEDTNVEELLAAVEDAEKR